MGARWVAIFILGGGVFTTFFFMRVCGGMYVPVSFCGGMEWWESR